MPSGTWTKKQERQYKSILKACQTGPRKRGKRPSLKVCKRIAAATVNKRRRTTRSRSGVRTKSTTRKMRGLGCGCGG